MKALLYADWCVLRGIGKRAPIPALAIVAVAALAPLADSAGNARELASAINASIMPMSIMMLTFLGFFALFGSDERQGWEAARLSLSPSRGSVVAARYAIIAAWALVLTVAGFVLSMAVCALATTILCHSVAFPDPVEVLTVGGTFFAACLAYLSITTPIVVKMGLAKGRLYFSIPFMLCMLFMTDPVREAATSVANGINGIVEQLGSPLPLVFGAIAGVVVMYLLSLKVSQALYARKDF